MKKITKLFIYSLVLKLIISCSASNDESSNSQNDPPLFNESGVNIYLDDINSGNIVRESGIDRLIIGSEGRQFSIIVQNNTNNILTLENIEPNDDYILGSFSNTIDIGAYDNIEINDFAFSNIPFNTVETSFNIYIRDRVTTSSTLTVEPIRIRQYVYTDDSLGTSIINNENNNPLFNSQWYINNTGQTGYAKQNGTASSNTVFSDLNLRDTRAQGITGHGVRVRVIDSGLDINHPDMHTPLELSCYLRSDGSCSSYDPEYDVDGDHGTSVAGIIGMKDENTIGGVGVAPRALISGYNFLEVQSISSELASIGSTDNTGEAPDVINMSYGTDLINNTFSAQNVDFNVYQNGVEAGTIYVKAAGNSFGPGEFSNTRCIRLGISCTPATNDMVANAPHIIVTASLNANGEHSSYSNAGSNIWISGFGGEYGYNLDSYREVLGKLGFDTNSLNFDSFTETGEPAMVTTDVVGCSYGYSQVTENDVNSYSDFNYPFSAISEGIVYIDEEYGLHSSGRYSNPHTDNSNCDYTNRFNGTSSAAPSISGVVALMKEIDPNINWREVKYILAKTARKVDPSDSEKTESSIIIDNGWITNDAGNDFNDKYGFGVIDADAAINMLQLSNINKSVEYEVYQYPGNAIVYQDYSLQCRNFRCTSNTRVESNTNHIINIPNGSISSIEGIFIGISIDQNLSADEMHDISVEVESPNGTSHLIIRPFMEWGRSHRYITALSNAFYEESATGDWTIRINNYNNEEFNYYPSLIIFGD